VLLHVAAVDGRHGGRPARPRPDPTLPRQGLGFWRSAPGPGELRELAGERGQGEAGDGGGRRGLDSPDASEWTPSFDEGGSGLSRARERAEGLEGRGERGGGKGGGRRRWGLELYEDALGRFSSRNGAAVLGLG